MFLYNKLLYNRPQIMGLARKNPDPQLAGGKQKPVTSEQKPATGGQSLIPYLHFYTLLHHLGYIANSVFICQ